MNNLIKKYSSQKKKIQQKKNIKTTYLIVAGHVEGHQPLQKDLGHFVVAEEGVPVDVVELTGLWHRAAGALQEVGAAWGGWRGVRVAAVQAEEAVEPALHLVAWRVPDGFGELDLVQDFAAGWLLVLQLLADLDVVAAWEGAALLAQLVDELEREGATCAFVSVTKQKRLNFVTLVSFL